MILLRKPAASAIRCFLAAQQDQPFSYPAVGATHAAAPPGWTVDHNRTRLGTGPDAWAAAVAALRRWEMFRLGWVAVVPSAPPIAPGRAVAIYTRQLGFWTLNACRIVYVVDEAGPPRRYGFAYGTLPEHIARGEERFLVEWRPDDSVWYDLLAFSRPRHPLAWLGYPVARLVQRRFARASKRAMRRAVRECPTTRNR
jgi:uncharacterized protein (UPF0548 family)